jgi:hypothetical protein
VDNSLPERVVGDEKRVFHIVLHMVGTLIQRCNAGCLSLYVNTYNEKEERHNQDWMLRRANFSGSYVCVKFEIRIRESRGNLLSSSSSRRLQGPNSTSSEMGLSFNMCKKIVQVYYKLFNVLCLQQSKMYQHCLIVFFFSSCITYNGSRCTLLHDHIARLLLLCYYYSQFKDVHICLQTLSDCQNQDRFFYKRCD